MPPVLEGEISRFSLLTIVVQGVEICYFDPPLLFSRINHGELRRLHQHHQQGIQGTGRESHEDVLRTFEEIETVRVSPRLQYVKKRLKRGKSSNGSRGNGDGKR